MGASNLLGSGNADEMRTERNNRVNPPEYAPGQDDDDDFFDDDFFDDSVDTGATNPSLGAPMGSFNPMASQMGTPMGAQMGTQMGMQQQQPQRASVEDQLMDGAVAAGKSAMSFLKAIVPTFKNTTPKFWSVWGSNTFVVGGISGVVGLVLWIFRIKSLGTNLLVGGLISMGTGALVLMSNVEKAKQCTSYYKDSNMIQPSQTPNPMNMQEPSGTSDFSMDSSDEEFPDYTSDDDEENWDDSSDDGYDDWGEDEDDDFLDESGDILGSAEANTSTMSIEEAEQALNTMGDLPAGVYTRQFLFDRLNMVLENNEPKFRDFEEYTEDDDVFITWENQLRDACEVTGIKPENLPTLISMRENKFVIILESTRPTRVNVQQVADELANIYADAISKSNKADPRIHAEGKPIGKKLRIIVYTGESALVTYKDYFKTPEYKEWVLDTKNYMPVIIGNDEFGEAIKIDFKKINTYLIAGEPRSGKSWLAQAILFQMCAFVPPSEMQIYICDPKGKMSDFNAFRLPHVKKFVYKDEDILSTLRHIVKVLAPKREELIGNAGFVNIWDYKEVHPEAKIPIIYILIDEVVTLSERMDKETKSEFQSLLAECVTRLPAAGYRLFMIPHVVKDEVIKKTTSDNIPCRISVRGDASHIESTTGTKKTDFKYKLSNVGDLAIKMKDLSSDTFYAHGLALSTSNVKNVKLFTYLSKIWAKIEPEELADSVARDIMDDAANERAIKQMELIDKIKEAQRTGQDTSDLLAQLNSLPTDNRGIPEVPQRNISNPLTNSERVTSDVGVYAQDVNTNGIEYESYDPLADDDDDDLNFDF